MIYREFQDLRLSALGMGAMRLPVLDGEDSQRKKWSISLWRAGSTIMIQPGVITEAIRSSSWERL